MRGARQARVARIQKNRWATKKDPVPASSPTGQFPAGKARISGFSPTMPICSLAHETDWAGWRRAARAFVLAKVEPAELTWTVGGNGDPVPEIDGGFTLSRTLVALAAQAFQAREAERFGLLYSIVWRAHHGGIDLTDAGDLDLRLTRRWALAVRADAHRMRTLVRFVPTTANGEQHFLGWYEPDHFVL